MNTREKHILGQVIPIGFDGYLNHADSQTIVTVGTAAVLSIPMAQWVILILVGITTEIKLNYKGNGNKVKR